MLVLEATSERQGERDAELSVKLDEMRPLDVLADAASLVSSTTTNVLCGLQAELDRADWYEAELLSRTITLLSTSRSPTRPSRHDMPKWLEHFDEGQITDARRRQEDEAKGQGYQKVATTTAFNAILSGRAVFDANATKHSLANPWPRNRALLDLVLDIFTPT